MLRDHHNQEPIMPDDYDLAEQRYRAADYQAAGALFHRLWDAGNPGAGLRYAACLRKAGHPRHALRVARRLLSAHAMAGARLELAWDLYESLRYPAGPGDFARWQAWATESLDQGAGPAVELIVLAVIDEARRLGEWEGVLTWCDRLDPAGLDAFAVPAGSHVARPPRHRWYAARIKALLMLRRGYQARPLAVQALAHYPTSCLFARYAAVALAGQGELLLARAELAELIRRHPKDWPTLFELARIEAQLGYGEAALGHAARAACLPGDDDYRYALFGLLADLYAAQGQFEIAACHVVLARAGYDTQGLPPAAGLKKLERQLRAALAATDTRLPTASFDGLAAIRARCLAAWQGTAETGRAK